MFRAGVLLITILTICLPLFASQAWRLFPHANIKDAGWQLPALAGFLFLAAFFIPDIHISKETSTFQQHFVGGGMYSTVLYIYFSKLLGWKFRWPASLALLFAWVSTLGVANELVEFTLTKLHLARIGTGDTSWDLMANTLGALTGYAIYKLIRRH